MRKLEAEPEIISMALALKLDPQLGSVKEILNLCRAKIAKIAAKFGNLATLDELQSAVAAQLSVVFEEVWSDDDLTAVVKKYVAMGEFVFADLPNQLDQDTFASLIEREQVNAGAPDRYIAVIDCRGDKAARRYFTRWHEIAHILTFVKQLELPFIRHRSTKTHEDPIERLMDTIAGDVGFFDPLFTPALREELAKSRFLTFDGIQRVRDRMCPIASYQAALIACTSRSPIPTVVLQAEMAYKKCEEQAVRSQQMQMFGAPPPKPKLRAVASTQNPAARSAGFIIHRNMAIPAASLIAKHFEQTGKTAQTNEFASGEEELSIWRHSDGKAIGFGPAHIECRWIGTNLTAILQQLLPRRNRVLRSHAAGAAEQR